MPTCFVIQGFGEKTDLTNGRKLNLDASYQVIKEAAEDAGLKCVRADEIVHSGTIDVPMYRWIYDADLVIADLSTYNVNAAYELGVRYALKPYATMIVAEDQFKNPFDLGHIVIRPYKHLGDDIGAQEARRFKRDLTAAIREILPKGEPDSPVYTYLTLRPPTIPPASRGANSTPAPRAAAPPTEKNAKELLDQARAALAGDKFVLAAELFKEVLAIRPEDESVVQQLALATYKCKQPDAKTALLEAHKLLQKLDPAITNNPETLGLWGAVHKRLWELDGNREYLDASIAAHERGFYLKQDYYNGINLAFLLNLRAGLRSKAGETAEAITDFVLARRVRTEVVGICKAALATAAGGPSADEEYWITATLWEAFAGLQDTSATQDWQRKSEALAAASWMIETTKSQIAKLAPLLAASPLKVLEAR